MCMRIRGMQILRKNAEDTAGTGLFYGLPDSGPILEEEGLVLSGE